MSTLQEIEAAVTTLSPEDLKVLAETVRHLREEQEEQRLMELEHLMGFRSFPKRNNRVVTTEMVLKLCEEESI